MSGLPIKTRKPSWLKVKLPTGAKQERFARLAQQIELALKVRDRGDETQRRRRSMGLLSLGADKHAEAREHALYRLITLGEALEALQVALTTLHARPALRPPPKLRREARPHLPRVARAPTRVRAAAAPRILPT